MHGKCSAAVESGRRLLLRAAGAAPLLAWSHALAVESDPLPVPQGTPRERAVRVYNEGVKVLLERRHAEAQKLFEQALALDEKFAEAHNNLAYSVRMQGAQHFERALRHYNRAIELKPALAQAYMYRGVLFTQMGDMAKARADHARLLGMDRDLAARLALAIDKAVASPDDRSGIAGQYE
ncbi:MULTISPECIES: tetratricopeptide repeat protein [unclassified Variovorax]|jgi:tetratricopeptide (TPR) repeat protein|uniref:tetratricopeptide repeat protein n=1 Tax=unclassified Variovorax TaxID=663243 RepID=UPI003ECF1D66